MVQDTSNPCKWQSILGSEDTLSTTVEVNVYSFDSYSSQLIERALVSRCPPLCPMFGPRQTEILVSRKETLSHNVSHLYVKNSGGFHCTTQWRVVIDLTHLTTNRGQQNCLSYRERLPGRRMPVSSYEYPFWWYVWVSPRCSVGGAVSLNIPRLVYVVHVWWMNKKGWHYRFVIRERHPISNPLVKLQRVSFENHCQRVGLYSLSLFF